MTSCSARLMLIWLHFMAWMSPAEEGREGSVGSVSTASRSGQQRRSVRLSKLWSKMRLSFICPWNIQKISNVHSRQQRRTLNMAPPPLSLAEVDGADGEGEGPASINPLELPRAIVVLVELLHHFSSDFVGRLLAVDLAEGGLGAIVHVDGLDHLARVLLEEEDEEFVGTALNDVRESLPLLSVQFPRKNHIGDGIYHLLLVGLSCEGVFAVLGLQSCLLITAPLPLSFPLEDTRTLTTTLAPALFGHALGGAERTQRLFFFPICLEVVISGLFVSGRTGFWIGMVGGIGREVFGRGGTDAVLGFLRLDGDGARVVTLINPAAFVLGSRRGIAFPLDSCRPWGRCIRFIEGLFVRFLRVTVLASRHFHLLL